MKQAQPLCYPFCGDMMLSSNEGQLLRFHGLDTLRAAAILVVMLYHLNMYGLLPAALNPIASVGWAAEVNFGHILYTNLCERESYKRCVFAP